MQNSIQFPLQIASGGTGVSASVDNAPAGEADFSALIAQQKHANETSEKPTSAGATEDIGQGGEGTRLPVADTPNLGVAFVAAAIPDSGGEDLVKGGHVRARNHLRAMTPGAADMAGTAAQMRLGEATRVGPNVGPAEAGMGIDEDAGRSAAVPDPHTSSGAETRETALTGRVRTVGAAATPGQGIAMQATVGVAPASDIAHDSTVENRPAGPQGAASAPGASVADGTALSGRSDQDGAEGMRVRGVPEPVPDGQSVQRPRVQGSAASHEAALPNNSGVENHIGQSEYTTRDMGGVPGEAASTSQSGRGGVVIPDLAKAAGNATSPPPEPIAHSPRGPVADHSAVHGESSRVGDNAQRPEPLVRGAAAQPTNMQVPGGGDMMHTASGTLVESAVKPELPVEHDVAARLAVTRNRTPVNANSANSVVVPVPGPGESRGLFEMASVSGPVAAFDRAAGPARDAAGVSVTTNDANANAVKPAYAAVGIWSAPAPTPTGVQPAMPALSAAATTDAPLAGSTLSSSTSLAPRASRVSGERTSAVTLVPPLGAVASGPSWLAGDDPISEPLRAEPMIGAAHTPLSAQGQSSTGAHTPHHDGAIARQVAAQIAEIARPMPDRPVEVALNPEELGRVRISFATENGALHVTLSAERPETLDLMRRHIDALAQELRQAGYRDLGFSFGSGGSEGQMTQSGSGGRATQGAPAHAISETETAAPIPAPLANTRAEGGVDLRL